MLDPEAKEFEIAYKGTGSSSGLCNNGTYQSATESFLSILKKDAETGKPLEGVVFGLYAQENIKNAARGSSCRKRCPD